MTSTARLMIAAFVALVSILAGFALAGPNDPASLDRSTSIGTLDFPAEGADTSGLVQRIVSAGLFPDARLESADEESAPSGGPLTLERVADALDAADPAAFVRAEEEWFVLLPDSAQGGFLRLSDGDMLDDAWRVVDIGPTAITVQRAGETRRLEAYAPSSSGEAE